ncbi:serine/threonine-protein kinase PINK1, mitochondrial isoform X2 [Stegostoma tigrinum]|uniref:serine/threonine-protein kinase PINK1, mitochondrial isoform X2 n=1 Tax=Stegostoma tigrinum TaxID=3053191 RepID=UPI00202B34D6|nr:serine/threonine-protein kinase PINK1, mitochondrial isoform X2 [Stegostoma tigrinum]
MSVRRLLARGLDLSRSALRLVNPAARARAQAGAAFVQPWAQQPLQAVLPARYRYFRLSLGGLAAQLQRRASWQLRGPGGALLAFGLGLGFIEQQVEEVRTSIAACEEIQTLFKRKKIKYENSMPSHTSGYRFEDYKIGYNIGKGCNAAVYKAFIPEVPKTKASDKITTKEKDEVVNRQVKSEGQCVSGEDSGERKKVAITQENSSLSFVILKKEMLTDSLRACEGDTSNPLRVSCGGSSYLLRAFEEDTNYPLKVPEGETSYPLALKMLWNINAGSSSDAILTSMVKELVPTIPNALIGEFGRMKGKKMKPHPNIIQIVRAFIDNVPLLPGAWMEYPDVLPTRLNPCGLGHDRTLFLVMKSYPCTLQQYLRVCIPNKECATVMILQLLEGVDHLVQHGIAHRDLKSDNILVEFDSVGCPRLVITDFGCCLAEESLGLKLPFTSNDVNRGGNICLMAPEISTAIPGPGVIIDYSKSDAWSVGTLAYEILGLRNPFYGYGVDYLESCNYQEDKLPPLPSSIHRDMRLVVKLLLCRDPKRRLSARVAADMLHLHLWGPELLASAPITVENVFRWLRCQTLLTLLQVSKNHKLPVEIELKRSFLANLSFEELRLGLDLLLHVKT